MRTIKLQDLAARLRSAQGSDVELLKVTEQELQTLLAWGQEIPAVITMAKTIVAGDVTAGFIVFPGYWYKGQPSGQLSIYDYSDFDGVRWDNNRSKIMSWYLEQPDIDKGDAPSNLLKGLYFKARQIHYYKMTNALVPQTCGNSDLFHMRAAHAVTHLTNKDAILGSLHVEKLARVGVTDEIIGATLVQPFTCVPGRAFAIIAGTEVWAATNIVYVTIQGSWCYTPCWDNIPALI